MKPKFLVLSSFVKNFVFILSLVGLVFLSAVLYKQYSKLSDSTDWVVHTYKVNMELEHLVSCLKDAEIGKSYFTITGDSILLQPFQSSSQKIKEAYQRLRKLTYDNDVQQKNLDTLNNLISLRFGLFEKFNALAPKNVINGAEINKNYLDGKDLMEQIVGLTFRMVQIEKSLLQTREKTYFDTLGITPFYIWLLLLFCLTVFTIAYTQINKNLSVLKKLNYELTFTNEMFENAEQIGHFSTWRWDVESNASVLSNNFYRLLCHEPQAFESNLKNFLKFVHPDDRHITIEANRKMAETHQGVTSFYRIIRKDGAVRHFKSISINSKNSRDGSFLTGYITDVTEQHLSDLALQNRNVELERSNAELSAFNHVASHDLQEPLRKIQTFISRIKEVEHLTGVGEIYFTRIESAATRMRALIDDLLAFSGASSSEKDFETADLIIILEKALRDLSEAILEKKAVIEQDILPTLNVIPFQIQQLFSNLVGNALKYAKPDVPLRIAITCEKVDGKDFSTLRVKNANIPYYKISITDNGLGFEQQYAESIFNPFQRLQNKEEYAGTGIGLSICKKVIENHAGVITAEGKVGEGSIFSFFLPA